MSALVTRNNLISTFLSEWSETPVTTENIKYDPDGSAYIFIRIAESIADQPCLGRESGETWERSEGDCVMSVYIPVNSENDGMSIADDARNVLSQRRINSTITGVGQLIPAGITADERYYLYNVRIPYRTDNVK